MNARQRMENLYAGKEVDRTPFAPAIYEHKAFLVDSTPTKVCKDADLFTAAMLEEYDRYRPDLLVVGIDVYNVEAEAFGCKVTYYKDGDDSIPGIRFENVAMEDGESPQTLGMPDPEKDGRMPINLEVAKRVNEKLGKEVMVRGAISGPYSLSCELIGSENFIVRTLTDPDYAAELMAHSSELILKFAKAYMARGVEPIVFDSRAMPPMTSPDIFHNIFSPAAKKMTDSLMAAGAKICPLIIGGDTTGVVDDYIATGSKNIISDFPCQWPPFAKACADAGIAVRRNINPATLQSGGKEQIIKEMEAIMVMGENQPRFIAGTGVVPFDTPSENVLTARDVVWNWKKKAVKA
jgi:uroporphyrinogen decarboxylase